MPTITVYQNDTEVDTETIEREYYIVETSGRELFWFEDEPNRFIPGALRIWLQGREEGRVSDMLCVTRMAAHCGRCQHGKEVLYGH